MPGADQVSRTPPTIGVAVSATVGGPRGSDPPKVTVKTCCEVRPTKSMTLSRKSNEPWRPVVLQKAAQTPDVKELMEDPLPKEVGTGNGAVTSTQEPLPIGANASSAPATPLCEAASKVTSVSPGTRPVAWIAVGVRKPT